MTRLLITVIVVLLASVGAVVMYRGHDESRPRQPEPSLLETADRLNAIGQRKGFLVHFEHGADGPELAAVVDTDAQEQAVRGALRSIDPTRHITITRNYPESIAWRRYRVTGPDRVAALVEGTCNDQGTLIVSETDDAVEIGVRDYVPMTSGCLASLTSGVWRTAQLAAPLGSRKIVHAPLGPIRS